MRASKNEIVKDMQFCQELMNRLVVSAQSMSDNSYIDGHTQIQSDIIRLRRELNTARKKLEWDYQSESGVRA